MAAADPEVSDVKANKMTQRHLSPNSPRPEAVATCSPYAGPDQDGGGNMGDPGAGVVTKTRPKTKKPSMYKVLMLNDDYTTMEFVVYVLERFFSKNREQARRIMLNVHKRGVGICGVYTYDVAETKATQVMDLARKKGHPLQCRLEKE